MEAKLLVEEVSRVKHVAALAPEIHSFLEECLVLAEHSGPISIIL